MKLWPFKRMSHRGDMLFLCFLDGHNFINNHPPGLKVVSNDAPCDLIQSALKFMLEKQLFYYFLNFSIFFLYKKPKFCIDFSWKLFI